VGPNISPRDSRTRFLFPPGILLPVRFILPAAIPFSISWRNFDLPVCVTGGPWWSILSNLRRQNASLRASVLVPEPPGRHLIDSLAGPNTTYATRCNLRTSNQIGVTISTPIGNLNLQLAAGAVLLRFDQCSTALRRLSHNSDTEFYLLKY